jgi:hypothetical protein
MRAPLANRKAMISRGAAQRPAEFSALTVRGLALGLVMVALTCVLVCYAELVVAKIQIGFLQLPPVVVGMLVLLLVGRSLAARISRRLDIAPHEVFTIYVMMLLASMVSSRGLLQKLIPLMVVPNQFATPENLWQSLFFGSIKRWAVPWDPAGGPKQPEAARFYGSLLPGQELPWGAWLGPLAAWGLFVALVFFAYVCLAVLLRKQWVDNEKLSFPLVQLPLEMIRPTGSAGFTGNRLTWLGFAVPAAVFGFNGLHQWYPSVPEVVTDINLNDLFREPPWNAFLFFHVFVSFAAIGFLYLLPTDLLFSLWFFFLLTRAADVLAASGGYQPEVMPMYGCLSFIGYQIIGCYVVMVGYMAWAARPHIALVWRTAFGLRRPEGDDELLSYRTAFWGLILSLLLSAGWLWALGMAYWLALFELVVLLFVVAVVMARSTCESGMLMTETSFRPIDLYRMLGDVRNLGASNITCLAFLDALWMRDQRGLVLTGFLDSMKLADGVRVRRRSLLLVLVTGLVTAVAVAGYLHLSLPYDLGAERMYSYVYAGNPVWAFTDAATVLNRNRPPLPWIMSFNFLIGVLTTTGIVIMRARSLWFPIHPLGYALCGTWTMMVFWFPCFVAWLAKVLILRYGGMRLYARARPFFLGMVLGEFTMAVVWTAPSLFWRTPTPAFPWP